MVVQGQLAAVTDHPYIGLSKGPEPPLERFKRADPELNSMPRYEDILHVDQRTAELSRARQSLLEEIEAIMFYDERASATKDETLKAVMKHNRDDEKEHFSLLLEWLRRNDPELERELRENLFSKKPMENLGD